MVKRIAAKTKNKLDYKYDLLRKAIDYAFDIHQGQYRADDKTPYIIHPLNVMVDVMQFSYNMNVCMAAVLHDTLEDSDQKNKVYVDIEQNFGIEVANIVYILTRRKDIDETYDDYIERIVFTKNYDAMLIKLCDISHNLKTLNDIPCITEKERFEKQLRYAEASKYLMSEFKKQCDIEQ